MPAVVCGCGPRAAPPTAIINIFLGPIGFRQKSRKARVKAGLICHKLGKGASQSAMRLRNPSTPSKQIGRAQSELQSPCNLVCRLLLEKKKKKIYKLCNSTHIHRVVE